MNEELVKCAIEAREKAFAHYSNFKVGAALLTASGEFVTGCNIENASYGLTICAERVAIFKAISDGNTEFVEIAVVADTEDTEELVSPCGACRQIIWEFCGDIPLTFANLHGKHNTFRTSELLPFGFDKSFLRNKE
ncbi:MAG: cytidine deaminase [Pyrinomonadaceae bacterium]